MGEFETTAQFWTDAAGIAIPALSQTSISQASSTSTSDKTLNPGAGSIFSLTATEDIYFLLGSSTVTVATNTGFYLMAGQIVTLSSNTHTHVAVIRKTTNGTVTMMVHGT